MTTSRGSGATRFTTHLACAGVLLATGCASLRHVGSPGPRPVAFVGEWVDVAATVEGDTLSWQLDASGAAHMMSVAGATHDTTRTSLGQWYVPGDSDERVEQLCFVRRPWREPASCFAFALDTLADGSVIRRRLRLTGRKRGAGRVLIEKTPAGVRPPLS